MVEQPEESPQVITREYYNKEYFHTHSEYFTPLKNRFQQYRIRHVMDIYTPSKAESVLDMGVGWGTFSLYTSDLCRQVTGIDYSLYAVSLCNSQAAGLGKDNIRYVCADVQHIPLKSGLYDVIICADLVEHLYPDQFERCMAECHRLLKTGGKVVVWAPNDQHWLEVMRKKRMILQPYPGHVDYKSMETVTASLEEKGFRIIKAYFVESHLPVIRFFEKLLLPHLQLFRRRIAILAEKTN